MGKPHAIGHVYRYMGACTPRRRVALYEDAGPLAIVEASGDSCLCGNYEIWHRASRLTIWPPLHTLTAARRALRRITPLADWTNGPETLKEVPGLRDAVHDALIEADQLSPPAGGRDG